MYLLLHKIGLQLITRLHRLLHVRAEQISICIDAFAFKGSLLDEIELVYTFMDSFLCMEALSDQIVTHRKLLQLRLATGTLFLLLRLGLPLFDLLDISLKSANLVDQDAFISPMIRYFLHLLALTEVSTIFALFQLQMLTLLLLDVSVELL